MRKKLFALFSVVLLSLAAAFLVFGLRPDAINTSAPSSPQNVYLRLASATTGGVFFAQGTAIEQLSSIIPGVTVFNQATNGSGENLALLAANHVELALCHNVTAWAAYYGHGIYEGRANRDFAAIGFLSHSTLHNLVLNDSGIESPYDLKGRSMSIGAIGSSVTLTTANFLSIFDLTFDDIRGQRVGIAESFQMLRNRQIDAVVHGSVMPDANVTDIMSTGRTKFIDMEQHSIDRLINQFDMFSQTTIPANTYPYQEQAINTVASAALILASLNADEEAIYRVTRAIYENHEKLMALHYSFIDTTLENALKGLGSIPLHPGAERFFREAGLL